MIEALFTALVAAPYVVAALLGLALPALWLLVHRHFGVGLCVVLVTSVLEVAHMGQPFLRVGLTLYVPDIPIVMVASAAALRWLCSPDMPRRDPVWLVVVVVFMVGFALGLARYGTSAGVQARPLFYALATASYAMSFAPQPAQLRQLMLGLRLVALALVAMVSYRWLVVYWPLRDLLPPGGTYNVDGAIRVIGANWTLSLAISFVAISFFARSHGGAGFARVLALPFLAYTLLLQHRSVWLALIAGVLMALLVARAQRVPFWQQAALLVATAATAVAPLLFSQSLSSQLERSAGTALAGQGTVDARFGNWQATLEQWWGDGPRARLLGRESGADTVREIQTERGRQKIAFGAHNNYVDSLTRLGLLGFGALLLFYGRLVRGLVRALRRRDEHSTDAALLLVLVTMQFVFYVAYQADYVGYLIMGLAAAWVAGTQRHTEAAATRPMRMPHRRPAQALVRS
jgi:O-antigen ligase